MENTEEHIALLRHMSAILRQRSYNVFLTEFQNEKCKKGIVALDKAVEALEVQVHA